MRQRYLNLDNLLKYRSVFLFGPRQVGKSTYLLSRYPFAKYYNLLQADTFSRLASSPEFIRLSLKQEDSLIIIDEIQKLPVLLDEVQAIMLSRPDLRFILTGSSARKLKRGGANLLAGRAHIQNFHPLVFPEVKEVDLLVRLNRGNLPAILDSEIYKNDLKNYVGTYLQEEILQEALSRGVESFSRFIEVAALSNGKQVNFTEIGSDAGISPRTIREYYQILEDTLIGRMLPAFQDTVKRKPVSTAKFYFFDLGVLNCLVKRGYIEYGTELFGEALEHLVYLELRAYLDYSNCDLDLCYWRSLSQLEVDFVIGNSVAIEVKAKNRISRKDYKHLLALKEELSQIRTILVCTEKTAWVSEEGVEILPVELFLEQLWSGEICPSLNKTRP